MDYKIIESGSNIYCTNLWIGWASLQLDFYNGHKTCI